MPSSRKVYVIDTSTIIHACDCFEKFEENDVVFPIQVIEELDKKKSEQNGVGWSAREASRTLELYRMNGLLLHGVPKGSGGMLYVDYNGSDFTNLPVPLERTNDNKILCTALHWQKKDPDRQVIVVSKDINLRIKASALGLYADDYKADKLVSKLDDLYSGCMEICLPRTDQFLLTRLYSNKLFYQDLEKYLKGQELIPNQCCRLKCAEKYGLAIYNHIEKRIEPVVRPFEETDISVGPRNDEQALAYSLLLNPKLTLVTLVGRAGTGKTLLALVAGDKYLDDKIFKRMAIYRPTIPLGRDIGYLKGDLMDKIRPWFEPIIDNYEVLWEKKHSKNEYAQFAEIHPPRKRGKRSERDEQMEGEPGEKYGKDDFRMMISAFFEMVDRGIYDIGPINYSRGRSIANSYIIIEEAQNLTPHQIKTLVSRASRGTKVVLTGDPDQIDNQYLDSTSNGLTYLVERFKGQPNFGHITLVKGERSQLAEQAANLL